MASYSVRSGKPVGPIGLECGLTCESFECKGFTIGQCITKYNANNKHNDFAPQFDAAWKVGLGITRKRWGSSNAGGRTECGTRIEFPKLLVLQKDFETIQDVKIKHVIAKHDDASGLGVGDVPDFFGFATTEPVLGF